MAEIVLHITPQPFVKVLPSEAILFRIPEKCYRLHTLYTYLGNYHRLDKPIREEVLEEIAAIEDHIFENSLPQSSQGCIDYLTAGECKHILQESGRRRRARINRYNQYKKDIKILCDQHGFNLQVCGWAVYFFFPMPVRWSKKKKARMRGQWKISKPDCDNLLKAICDSLGKRRGDHSDPTRLPDEIVAGLSGIGKYWTDKEQGYIEIFRNQPVYNPYNVEFIDQLIIHQ